MNTTGRILLRIGLAVISLGVVVLMLLVLAGVFHEKVESDHATAPTGRPLAAGETIVPVESRQVPQAEWSVGTVRAVHETTLGARLLATVVQVHVEAGQDVEADQVLVQLDDRDLKAGVERAAAQVEAARASRDQAKSDYDRIAPLRAEGSASAFELSTATNSLRAAEAELQKAVEAKHEAETILTYATIRAPVAGRIVDKLVEVGDIVTAGQPLLTMYDPTRMQLVASVREGLRQRLDVGQKVTVKLAALDYACEAEVSEIVPEAESASRSFLVKVTGPCPPGVYPGMFGRLQVPLDARQAIVIPAPSIRTVGQLDLVEVVEGKTARRRLVQVGQRIDGQVEVLSGLTAGEQVVVPAETAS